MCGIQRLKLKTIYGFGVKSQQKKNIGFIFNRSKLFRRKKCLSLKNTSLFYDRRRKYLSKPKMLFSCKFVFKISLNKLV